MRGAFSSSQASTIAWTSSMLLTLKAPRAYLPRKALANSSLVCVSGIFLVLIHRPETGTRPTIVIWLRQKETKISGCNRSTGQANKAEQDSGAGAPDRNSARVH